MFSSFLRALNGLPWFLKPQVLGLALLTGFFLVFVVLGIGFLTREIESPLPQTTAIMNVIVAPTLTKPIQTATADLSPTSEANEEVNRAGEDILLDAYVQISGTGGTGLRFRLDPSLNGQVKFVSGDAEIFIVKDGPIEADGYTWWYLVGPFDETRNGWAVSNYLVLTQNP